MFAPLLTGLRRSAGNNIWSGRGRALALAMGYDTFWKGQRDSRKAELTVRTPSKSRIDFSGLAWHSGFLPLGTWVQEQEELDSSASCLTSLSMEDPTWEEGQVTPQVLSWGNCQQKTQKTQKKLESNPVKLAPDKWTSAREKLPDVVDFSPAFLPSLQRTKPCGVQMVRKSAVVHPFAAHCRQSGKEGVGLSLSFFGMIPYRFGESWTPRYQSMYGPSKKGPLCPMQHRESSLDGDSGMI